MFSQKPVIRDLTTQVVFINVLFTMLISWLLQIRSEEVKEGGEVMQCAFKARKLDNKVNGYNLYRILQIDQSSSR